MDGRSSWSGSEFNDARYGFLGLLGANQFNIGECSSIYIVFTTILWVYTLAELIPVHDKSITLYSLQ